MNLDKMMLRLARGDRAAFKGIYDDTREAMYYIALAILRERMLAEDVMQSAYLKVIEYANTYQPGTNARAWILRIARNEAINLKKRRSWETCVDTYENEGMFGNYSVDEYGDLVDIARKILAEDEFQILMLITASGYKRREIAEILEIPIATVTWKYNQALKKMREILKKQ